MSKLISSFAAAALVFSLAGITTGWSQEPKTLPLVWVLSTGGTIAGAGASSTNLAEYKGRHDPGRATDQGRAGNPAICKRESRADRQRRQSQPHARQPAA